MKNLKRYILREVCFEITNLCALDCVHCSNFDSSATHKTYHRLQQIKRTIDDMAALGAGILEFSGGEPLMHPDIIKAIQYAKTKHLKTVLYTSGIVSNADPCFMPLSTARRLQKFGLNTIVFNLEGSTPTTHESITRVPGSFENTIKSLRNASSQGLQIAIHFVPMKPNFKDLGNVVKLCHNLKVSEVGILRFVPQGRGHIYAKELALSKEETLELMYDITRIKHSLTKTPTIRVGRPQNFCPLVDPSARFNICNAGISKCLIKPNGEVVPCPAFKQNSDYVAGNINGESLREIWLNSPIFTPFRTFDYRKLKECSRCPRVFECRGRCIAQRIIATGNMFRGLDPCCPMLQTMTSQVRCVAREGLKE